MEEALTRKLRKQRQQNVL